MNFINNQVCLLELRGIKPQLVQIIKIFSKIFSLFRIALNLEDSMKQKLEEQKQNHHNELEALKKEVSELEGHLEILLEKKRKHTSISSFLSAS